MDEDGYDSSRIWYTWTYFPLDNMLTTLRCNDGKCWIVDIFVYIGIWT